MEKKYAYIRVSTLEQNDLRQRIEMEKLGINNSNIFADKVSGVDFDRPQYKKLKKRLQKGDLLVLKNLDMPILDTRANKDLMGTLIPDIVLQLLSYVAQVERENIRQRQAEELGITVPIFRGLVVRKKILEK